MVEDTIYYIVYCIFLFFRHKFYKYVWRALWLSLAKCPAGEALTLPPPPSFTPLNSCPKLLCVHFVLECPPSERDSGRWRCAVRLNKNTFCTWCETCVLFFFSFFLSFRSDSTGAAQRAVQVFSTQSYLLYSSRVCASVCLSIRLSACVSVSLSKRHKNKPYIEKRGEKERGRYIFLPFSHLPENPSGHVQL